MFSRNVFRSPNVQHHYQKLTARDAQKPSLQLPVINSSDPCGSARLSRKSPKNSVHQFPVAPFSPSKPQVGAKGTYPPSKSPRPPIAKNPVPPKNSKAIQDYRLSALPGHKPQDGQYAVGSNIPPSLMSRGGSLSTVIGGAGQGVAQRPYPQYSNQGPNVPQSSHGFFGANGPMLPPVPSTSKASKKRPSPKKERKSSPSKKPKLSSPPVDAKAKAAAANLAATKAGTSSESAAALAAAIMRGVTMRPSGKWQAQLYYAGKSRYIGVFDSREKAALAYEIAREKLKADPKETVNQDSETTESKVSFARKAAFEGVNEPDPKQGKKK